MGDRLAFLRSAAACLAQYITKPRYSSILESQALLPEGAAEQWNLPFYNMAMAGECALAPLQLLDEIKRIEKELGRVDRGFWGPREIDIDILCMDRLQMQDEALRVPHAGLLERDFALLPLCELVPEWIYPLPGMYQGMKAIDIAASKGYGFGPALQKTEHRIHG